MRIFRYNRVSRSRSRLCAVRSHDVGEGEEEFIRANAERRMIPRFGIIIIIPIPELKQN